MLQAQVQLAHSQGPILVQEGGDLVPEPQVQAFRKPHRTSSKSAPHLCVLLSFILKGSKGLKPPGMP